MLFYDLHYERATLVRNYLPPFELILFVLLIAVQTRVTE